MKRKPEFGDIYEIDTGERTYLAMFICPMKSSWVMGDWWGMQLEVVEGKPLAFVEVGEVRDLVSLGSWRFVESLG